MSKTTFSTLRTAAEKELKSQETSASRSENNIAARTHDMSVGGLIGRILGVIFLAGFILALNSQFDMARTGPEFIREYAPIIQLLCSASVAVFAVVMIIRDISLMSQVGAVQKARNEVAALRKGLGDKVKNLPAQEKTFVAAAKKGYDLKIDLPISVPDRVQELEREITQKADQRTEGINKAIVVLFYIAMTFCGIVGAVAVYNMSTGLIGWVTDLLEELVDLDITGLTGIMALISMGLGVIAQYFPGYWYTNGFDGELTWWAPVVFLAGALCTLLGAVALCLLVAAVGLIVVLIGIAIAIGAVVLGFYLVSIFCCGG